jgi:hypothetical protein
VVEQSGFDAKVARFFLHELVSMPPQSQFELPLEADREGRRQAWDVKARTVPSVTELRLKLGQDFRQWLKHEPVEALPQIGSP